MIRITVGGIRLKAELRDTATAEAIAGALPMEGRARRWGGEIYFPIPVEVPLETDSTDSPEVGELGYWPAGNAFCIFFGATPVSTGDEPRAASNVNVFGKIIGDVSSLWDVADGEKVIVDLHAEGDN